MAQRVAYTLGFVHCGATDEVLLLNRARSPWMGKWNGVGGKLLPAESPRACIARETAEETGFAFAEAAFTDRGTLSWRGDLGESSLQIFTVEVSQKERESYATPTRHCAEGILDWKPLAWAADPQNAGVVDNLLHILPLLSGADSSFRYDTVYESGRLKTFQCSARSASEEDLRPQQPVTLASWKSEA